MKAFPHAKINVGLFVTGHWEPGTKDVMLQSRPDQRSAKRPADTPLYHEIESILLPVSLYDTLEVTISPDKHTHLLASGIPIPGKASSNLCFLAYELLRNKFPDLPPVNIHLHKQIPPGSGLGGGSSDAAHTLMLLNKLFRLQLSEQDMLGFAASLGSDCPFFLQKNPMWVKGRGETGDPITMKALDKLQVLIVVPPLQISTAWAYGKIAPKKPGTSLEVLARLPVYQWQGKMQNHFEEVVFSSFPELKDLRNTLSEKGATYSSLTGTGSAVYGLFPSAPPADEIQKMYPEYHVFITSPGVC